MGSLQQLSHLANRWPQLAHCEISAGNIVRVSLSAAACTSSCHTPCHVQLSTEELCISMFLLIIPIEHSHSML